jgi:Protein of unknown function (DUF3574)
MQIKPNKSIAPNLILAGSIAICATLIACFNEPEAILALRPSVETTRSPEIGDRQLCPNARSGSLFVRTELLFGLQKPDGTEVTDAEFQIFINREVTPRFPDGLTLLTGQGQFKNSQGIIIREKSRLLVLLYPIERETNSNKNVEHIREAYKSNFKQESVLRADNRSCVYF